MSEPDFMVDVRTEGRAVVIAPRGEIDLATVEAVRAALRDHEGDPRGLVLDLRDVEFLDSSGLTLILEQHRRAADDGYGFALRRGPAAVQRLFEVTGLLDRLNFVDEPHGTGGNGRSRPV